MQRKIATSATQVFDDPNQLSGQRLSPVVTKLISDDETYYLPDTPPERLSSPAVVALEKKKYLLGETHDSGEWERRTKYWSYVTKMREGGAWFHAEPGEEKTAADQAISTGAVTLVDMPLQDVDTVFLAAIMRAQQMLGDFDKVLRDKLSMTLLTNDLVEIYKCLGFYRIVSDIWLENREYLSPWGGTRAAEFMQLGQAIITHETELAPILPMMKTTSALFRTLTTDQAMSLRPVLHTFAKLAIELIDNRPRSNWFWRLLGWPRQGQDPITNRSELTRLSDPRIPVAPNMNGVMKAITEGNAIREPKMVASIKAAPAPLLVQMGENHVTPVHDALGDDAVAVHEKDNFVSMIIRRQPR